MSGILMRGFALAFAAVLALVMMSANALAQRASDPAAERFVQELANESLNILSDAALSRNERAKRFQALFLENTALRAFGRSALGRYSRVVTDAQFEEYLTLLEDYAILIIRSRLDDYSGETVSIDSSQVDERPSITYVSVDGRVINQENKLLARITLVLIRSRDQYRLFDLRVTTPGESGTFSLLATQRDEFDSVITNNRRDINALLNHLRRQIEKMSAET
jgi:ABC-type transporter MlaC component